MVKPSRKFWRRCRWAIGGLIAGAIVAFFSIPTLAPVALGLWRDDILFRVPDASGQIFLTIDDAPSKATPRILEVLARHDVPATFFIIGGRVQDSAQLDVITARGHDIAHHMQTTRACSKLPRDEFVREFDAVAARLTGAGGVRLFRPPSDFGTREQIAYVERHGYRTVLGTVFPFDHAISHPGNLRRLARWQAIDGGIIILHDGDDRGARTAEVLDRLIPELKRRGYTFARLATAILP